MLTVNSLLILAENFTETVLQKISINSDKIIRNRLQMFKGSPQFCFVLNPIDLHWPYCKRKLLTLLYTTCILYNAFINCFSVGFGGSSIIHPSVIRYAIQSCSKLYFVSIVPLSQLQTSLIRIYRKKVHCV